MTEPFRAAAEVYWAAGWRGTLPLPAARKGPPPTGWTGADAPDPSGADLQSWLDAVEPGANLGLRLPDGIVGIDVDCYEGKTGAATLADLQARWGALPPTWRSTSRDDGTSGIRLYRVPDGLAWPGVAGQHIEIIQRRHRYVVAPPSIHPTGRPYRWIDPHGQTLTMLFVPSPQSLPALPEQWVAGLTAGRPAQDTVRADDQTVAAWHSLRSGGDPCPAMTLAIERGTSAISAANPSRHEAARGWLAHVAKLAAEGHPGLARAQESFGAAFAQATQGEQRMAEFARLAAGALAIGAAHPARSTDLGDPCADAFARHVPAPTPSFSLPPATPATAGGFQPEAEVQTPEDAQALLDACAQQELWRLQVRERARQLLRSQGQVGIPPGQRLSDLLDAPDEPVQWRIGAGGSGDRNLLPVGGNAVLAAQRKAGKTTLIANLAKCLVDGGEFLGHFPTIPVDGTLGLLDFEMSDAMLRRWYRRADIIDTGRMWVSGMRGSAAAFDILDPKRRSEWAKILVDQGVTFLIIDPLAPILDSLGIDENHDVGKVLVAVDALKAEAGIRECIVVHHAGHSGERSRGHSRLRDWPDAEWRIVREQPETPGAEPPPDARRFFAAEGREVAVCEAALCWDPVTGTLALGDGTRAEAKIRRRVDDKLGAVIEYLATTGCARTTGEIYAAVRGRREDLTAALAAGVERRLLRLDLGARGIKTYSLPDAQQWQES